MSAATEVAFHLSQTINDDNEAALPFKLYLTRQEMMLMAMMSMPVYPIADAAIGGISSLVIFILSIFVSIKVINEMRKGKPSSWIWDWRYRRGFISDQRCWMRCSMRNPRTVTRHHAVGPHPFIGSKKRGDLLMVDEEWRRIMPPGGGAVIAWTPLAVGRGTIEVTTDEAGAKAPYAAALDAAKDDAERRRIVTSILPVASGGPAPIWFYGPEGFESTHIGHARTLAIKVPCTRSVRGDDTIMAQAEGIGLLDKAAA